MKKSVYMIKKSASILLIAIMCVAYACKTVVKVVVSDSTSLQTLEGATVINTCTNERKQTDASGIASFKMKKNEVCDFHISKNAYTSSTVSSKNLNSKALAAFIIKTPINNNNTEKINQIICNTNKPPIFEKDEQKISESTEQESNTDGVFVPCKYELWKKVDKYEDIISLNPLNDVIWTGAVIQGKNLIQGMPSAINLPRNPTTITLTGLNFGDNKSNSIQINDPSKSSVEDGIRKILHDRKPLSTTGQFNYSLKQVYSYEHALMSLGLSAKWNWGELSAQLSSKEYQKKNTFVVKLVQTYYSVSCPSPSAGGDVFQKEVTPSQLANYVSPDNPPCLITNINFGRIFLLSFNSNESESKVAAALNASFSNWGVKGNVNFDYEAQKILNDSEISIFAIGGSSEKIAQVIAGVDGKPKTEILKEYILQGANYSPESVGAPIGYKAVFLCDNSLAAVNSNTEFKIRTCSTISYKKPFTIKIDDLLIRDVTDDDEDMELYYSLSFYDQRGKKVGNDYTNSKPKTYVEERSKKRGKGDYYVANNPCNNPEDKKCIQESGWLKGKNVFFYNEPVQTISNQAIFKIRITVGAKTHDGDSDKPWKNKDQMTYWFKDIDVASLPGGQYSVSPWDCMDLRFTCN